MIQAVIEVHKCDDCGDIATVNVLDQLAEHNFINSWKIGTVFDFCPNCKDSEKSRNSLALEDMEIVKNDHSN